MVIYSREEWLKKNPEYSSKTEEVIFKENPQNYEDEIVEFTDDITGLTSKSVEHTEEKIISEFINIANCSDATIMIPDLFGPGKSLILGSLEKPSTKTPPPAIQVDGSFKNRLNQHRHYNGLLEKGLLKEVSGKTMNKFLKTFYEKVGEETDDQYLMKEQSLNELNAFFRGEEEPKMRESIASSESSKFGHSGKEIDVLTPSGKIDEIIDLNQNEELEILKELGISLEDTSGRLSD